MPVECRLNLYGGTRSKSPRSASEATEAWRATPLTGGT
eukprot:CAMPEP_0119355856 /NCGR_PEP_ID=MMETSP1334-20130426/4640_1 /TAXON_ID=127549 /ORGANISM="Calcidiscus leptoporus, Strain RCC1130" /LENGTH=37 /DNA_ID= /DNA_START= /DNA_END= /DNA_ORIENTATION=